MEATDNSALTEACAVVDGATRLAALLTERMGRTVSKASISRWKKERVPAEMCPDIEALTGVTCERLRPDVNWSILRAKPRVRKAVQQLQQQPAAKAKAKACRPTASDDTDLSQSLDPSCKG